MDGLSAWLASRRSEPYYWQAEELNQANQPVIGVTWYEAMAYSAWLAERFRESVVNQVERKIPADLAAECWQLRLPTEVEWEKAASWDPVAQHKRVYVWGNDWDGTRANVDNKVGRPSAVGVFPDRRGSVRCDGYHWQRFGMDAIVLGEF